MPLIQRSQLKGPAEKKKILVLSDHPLATSGVGVQARFLIDGLLKTGKYSFRCFGGAMKHPSYETVVVNQDFLIKPVDGFGNKDTIRNVLTTEKPDAILIFTDPRQFVWLWEIEDEIHQICPISYWHVWDNDPYPAFNKVWYDSTDLINCLSYKTYEMVKPHFPTKTHYIPHAFPKQVYFPAKEEEVAVVRQQNFGDKADWFSVLWVNRNASRKMPADLLDAWKVFLDKLEAKHGHRKAVLIMHTDPGDPEGPNLMVVQELMGLQNNVLYSTQKIDFNHVNVLHNITDCCINISRAEGFGLSTLISLQCGKPIVALKTGGLTRQVIDHRNGFELGGAIDPITRKLTGSQMVPYIYDDYASQDDVAAALMKVYELTPEQKAEIKEKALDYVNFEFNFDRMITDWDNTLTECIDGWHAAKEAGTLKGWDLISLDSTMVATPTMGPVSVTQQKVVPKVLGIPNLEAKVIVPNRKAHPKILERMGNRR